MADMLRPSGTIKRVKVIYRIVLTLHCIQAILLVNLPPLSLLATTEEVVAKEELVYSGSPHKPTVEVPINLGLFNAQIRPS